MKKVFAIVGVLLLITGGMFLYLYKTDFWSEKNIALRKLKSLEIPVSAEQVEASVTEGDSETLGLLKRAQVDFNSAETINEAGDSLLHVAFKKEDWETFKQLKEYGVELDSPDAAGLPVSSYIMDSGNLSEAETLFKEGAEVNISHPSGEAALIHYIKAQDVEKVLLLLNNNADPETLSQDKESPLFLSLKDKLPQVRQALLKAGASPNTTTPSNIALLPYFARKHSALNYSTEEAGTVLQELLDKGAETGKQDETGWRALQWLIHQRKGELAELIIAKDSDVAETLWIALKNNDYPMAKRLLELKADPQQAGPDGESPLITMVRKNRADMVTALLSQGADPKKLAKEGQNALITAITIKNSDAALALLRHPTNMAEHSAVMEYPVTDEFRALFGKRGYFDWYTQNREGLTPLMATIMRNELAVAEQLLANGADRFQALGQRSKVYPIQMAAENKNVKMQQLLIGVSYKDEDQVRKFVVDLSEQNVKYYNNGELKKTSRISSGKYGYRTTPGQYVITDKTRHKRSNIYDGASMPYFQRFSCGAIGFHEGNTYSRFASHGCIRLPMSTAQYFWGETSLGDRVDIVE